VRDARLAGAVAALMLAAVVAASTAVGAAAQAPAEARAVAFLVREVPRWKAENDCYSCHNNGDAARALIAAAAHGHDVGSALDDTLVWLRDPGRWDRNKTTGGIDDKPLARVQFANALARAVGAGRATPDALAIAARMLVADQKADGSWQLDTSKSLGSPTTYGTTLATAAARRTLGAITAARAPDVAAAVAKADAWLRGAAVDSVLDAAAVVLGLGDAADATALAQRDRALATIVRGQSPGGGWGPYTTVGPEVFDTALVVLALTELGVPHGLSSSVLTREAQAAALAGGRRFLVSQQMADGSWPETTRPANQESYAQRISTTGWALLALLATSPQ
jgi:hypothetical protein